LVVSGGMTYDRVSHELPCVREIHRLREVKEVVTSGRLRDDSHDRYDTFDTRLNLVD
jgi:hypothetical protein